ncbi:MAG: poly(ADP-ribose) glycohydrolase [Polyangiaceae bacterium]|jgi:poly(ADP-ribose) glycohydrolase|nr:poly(ADP-ribose) glycohydrolase [Polyangiaceae bacterium]
MHPALPPLPLPPPATRAAIGAAAAAPPPDLEALAGLLGALTGARTSLTAVAALLRAEPGLAPRLFERIVPAVLRHAAALPVAGAPSLLVTAQPGRVVLGRQVAASLVAHLVLGTLPPAPGQAMPHTSFDRLLATGARPEQAKLRCVLAYFDRIADGAPSGAITIERDVLTPRTLADWAADPAPLGPLEVAPEGGVEDSAGAAQVDFANRFLGGGVLSGGCVQEEIRFSVCPELLAALPLCAMMNDNEAIRLHGAERFAKLDGYGFTIAFGGDVHDSTPRLPDGTADVTLIAIDAIDLRRERDPNLQFQPTWLRREADKALVGFGGARPPPRAPALVATGHWGCGAFGGDHALKAVLQWLAASAAGVGLRYHTYGDGRAGDLEGFTHAARNHFGTVGALWSRLLAVAPRAPTSPTPPWLFDALLGAS